MNPALDLAIAAALHKVCDPCSIAANAPVSIIDMGLVKDWSVDEDANLVIRMALTSAGCTMGPHMVRGAERLLADIPGLKSARVEMDPSVFWTPADMSERGRMILDARRSASLARAELKPQQWRSQTADRATAADPSE